MKKIIYSEIKGKNETFGYYTLLSVFGLILAAALAAAWYMEHNGHYVTAMNNQIVWGMPHVFAIFLIVAASGALNVASIGSVFGKVDYKPLGRLSSLLAVALLIGGLAVLVLDLGRPDRLIIAMTHNNFTSIFAWNIFLYVGFIIIVAIYLWTQMERKANHLKTKAGLVALVWRLSLTTGTGSIFGFLVAREAYDSAVMAPLFIVMSFSFGLAFFSLVLMASYKTTKRELGDIIINRLGKLLGLFAATVLYFTAVQHLTNLYAAERTGVEQFILVDGGVYPLLFWFGQIIIGGLIPMAITLLPNKVLTPSKVAIASLLVMIGGFAQVYVIVIGGQAWPLMLFPGMVSTSVIGDGAIASYSATLPEILLGLGGFAIAGIMVLIGVRVMRFLPISLANSMIDPYYQVKQN